MEFAAFLICPIYSVLILHFFRSRPPPPLPIVQLNLKDRRGCKGWWGKWIVVCVVMMRDGGGSRRNLHPLWRALLHSHTTGDCPSIPPCLLRSSSSLPSLVPFTALLSPVDLCILFNYTLPFYPLNCCLFENVTWFICFHLFWRMLINNKFIVNNNYELNNKISSNWQLKSANSILISCWFPPPPPKLWGSVFSGHQLEQIPPTPQSLPQLPPVYSLRSEVRGPRGARGVVEISQWPQRGWKMRGCKKELALCKTTVTQAECWIKEKCDVFNKSNQFVQSSRKRGFRWNPQTLISSLRVDSLKLCCCEGANKSDDGVTCPTLTGSTGGTGKTNNAARTSCENHRKIIAPLYSGSLQDLFIGKVLPCSICTITRIPPNFVTMEIVEEVDPIPIGSTCSSMWVQHQTGSSRKSSLVYQLRKR